MLFTNEIASQYSTRRHPGFYSYSEIFRKLYPGYICDSKQCVRAENAKTLNFKKQIDMLKSTDASKFEEWTFFGSHRFLDGSSGVSDHKVGFCSFPRSGSSFLRRMIENCTGIVTGSSISLHTATGL